MAKTIQQVALPVLAASLVGGLFVIDQSIGLRHGTGMAYALPVLLMLPGHHHRMVWAVAFGSIAAMVTASLVPLPSSANEWEHTLTSHLPVLVMVVLAALWVKARAQQHQIKAHMKTALQTTDDAVIACNLQGQITAWNRGAETLYGFDQKQMLYQSIFRLTPGFREEELSDLLTAAAANHPTEHLESQHQRQDGQTIDVALTINPIHDATGKAIGATVIARDLTERNLLEARFQATVESAPMAILMIDEDGTIVLVNAETERMFGYKRHEMLGQALEMLVPDNHQKTHPGLRRTFFQNPKTRRMGEGRNLRAVRKDGTLFPVEIGLNPVKTQGRLFVLSAVVDITERVRATQQQDKLNQRLAQTNLALNQSNNELKRFAFVTSHDLLTPLRHIASFAELLAEHYSEQLDGQGVEWIQDMVGGVERLHTMIGDLQRFAGIDHADMTVQGMSLSEAVVLAKTRMAQDFEASKATLTYDRLPQVQAVRTLLIDLMGQLFDNALKFRGNQPPHVHVSAEQQDNEWVVRVADNGIGFKPKQQEEIFDIFKRLHPRESYEGSGMGLAICRRIVHKHGGRIWAEAHETHGTTICFSLPIKAMPLQLSDQNSAPELYINAKPRPSATSTQAAETNRETTPAHPIPAEATAAPKPAHGKSHDEAVSASNSRP